MALGGVWSRLTSGILGVGVGVGVSGAVEPLAQDARNLAWSAHPDLPLDPRTAAELVLEGEWDEGKGEDEARKTGIDGDRFRSLVKLIDQAPDYAALLVLRRRGLITDAELTHGLRKAHFEPEWFDGLRELAHELLTPSDLANARQQGFVSAERQRHETEQQGLSAADAEVLFELAGLPPGVETGLQMLQRGIIDESTFARIVAEGHTKTKYTDELLQLRWAILSPSVLANAAIRQHLTVDEAKRRAAQAGVRPEDFEIEYLTVGRPASMEQMLSLYNRGVVTKADFEKAIAQSDIRPEYADPLFELRHRLPSIIQVKQLVAANALPDQLAVSILVDQGYSNEIATAVVAGAHKTKTEKERDLVKSEIETLYEGRQISAQQAHDWIVGLGYDSNEADLLLALADARRVRKYNEAAIGRIHTLFVGHRISETDATNALNALNVEPDGVHTLIELWDLERTANVREATDAQLLAGVKKGLLDPQQVHDRLVQRGYTETDAQLLISLQLGPGVPGGMPAALGSGG